MNYFKLKFLLLFFALAVAIPPAWAETKTAGFTLSGTKVPIAANANPATTTITGTQGETWNVAINGTFTSSSMQGAADRKYWQMGKSKASITSATFSTSGISGNIKSIAIDCAVANGPGGSVSAIVGNSSFGSSELPKWENSTSPFHGDVVTLENSSNYQGDIVITIVPSNQNGCFIHSITVTYEEGGDTPPAEENIYQKVTNASQLVAGKTYIIVNESANVGMGDVDDNRYGTAVTGLEFADGKVNIGGTEVTELTLGGKKDAWTFMLPNTQYLAKGNEDNKFLLATTPSTSISKWTIDLSNGCSIINNDNSDENYRYIRYENNRFDISNYSNVALYVKYEGGDEPSTDPVIEITSPQLPFNDEGGLYTVNGSNLPTDGLGVNVTEGFDRYLENGNNEFYYFPITGGAVTDGQTKVTYTGRELSATGTITFASGEASNSADLSYRSDIYLYGDLSDNNHDDWGDIADGKMERNGDVYSKTITLNEKGFLLFARKTGETYGWDKNRLFFGPVTDGQNWQYVNDATDDLDLNPQTQYHPLELPAGIYTITINAVDNTFSISREELPTPIGEACPAVIEFADNTNESGDPADSTTAFSGLDKFLESVSSGQGFIQGVTIDKVYAGKHGIKFGTSKNGGNLTINLKSLNGNGSWRTTKVIVNAMQYEKSAGVYEQSNIIVNNTSIALTNELTDHEFVFDGSEISSLKVSSTARMYVKSITIMHECGDEPILEQVAIPTFTPAAGTYTEVQNVEINCATEDATIYYTTDGDDPTTSSAVYSTAIEVAQNMTIKAMAVKEGMENSAVASAEYIINLPQEVATITAAQALDDNATFNFTGNAVVTFHNSNHLYIRDESGSGLIYGVNAETKKYKNGDVLTAGWQAKNDMFQEYTPEFTDPSKVGSTVNNGAVEPLPLTTIELGDVNKYAKIDNVTITSNNGQNYFYKVGENQYCLRRAYTDMVGELEVNKTYNVTGVVTIFRSGSKDNYIYTPQLNLISAELIKEDLTLSFDPASVELYVGETFTAPTLKGVPEGATIDVTYSSNNTDVAIVTDNVVSLVKGATGTATITATFAGNDEYNEASASYTITVENKPFVMAEPTSLDFEAVIGQDPVTATFTVMADNLKGDITLTMTESDVFTITPTTIPKADMTEEGVVVTVTYTPKAATGEDYDEAIVTIKSTDAETVTVNLTGMATLPDPVLTVNPDVLDMGTDATGTFTVTGQNLTEDVTVTVTGENATKFTVEPATITMADAMAEGGKTVTVTYKGNSTEDEYATITVKSGNKKKEVIVTARVLPTPEIIADPESLTMAAKVGETATATFTVMASDLRGDITLTMSESDVFTIEPATIRKADMTEDGVEVTVTYKPTAAGSHEAIISVTTKDAETATVTLAGTATVPEVVAMPTFSLVAGSYTGPQQVTINCATKGATISYSTDGGSTWTVGNTVNVDKDMTIMAKAEKDGMTVSTTASATYVIITEEAPVTVNIETGYYQIKNLGNNQYANVAGRKTLNFTDAPADKAGTVIYVDVENDGTVKSLRSQAADLQRYADRAMSYVPEVVKIVAKKLNADGSGEILGETGLGKILDKFNECFDHNLHVEQAQGGYRLYGKTPSMQPVVEFYRENKDKVEAKLPNLEAFINSALEKLKAKIGGSSVFTEFKLHDIWDKMGGTLTEPVDAASTMAFYREVLNNKNYVWDFAYQTAMIYVNNLMNHPRWSEVEEQLGEYAQYIDKIKQIRPEFKYYIVQKDGKPDFISEGNKDIIDNAERTIWTLEPRTGFTVNFPEANKHNGEYVTTLYTDFAYTLPEGVTAYTVTEVSTQGVATLTALEGTIPAQTPVLLKSTAYGDQTVTLSTEAGTAPADNLLVGPDYLIKHYEFKTPQVVDIFNFIKDKLPGFYDEYVAQYEYLMLKTAGTVGNKYFWNVNSDLANLKDDCIVRSLAVDENGTLAFSDHWTTDTNKAFLVDDANNPQDVIKLSLRGDINKDGVISIIDVTALIDILLDLPARTYLKPTTSYPKGLDYEAADVNEINDIEITDVTSLIDILLNMPDQPAQGSGN